MQTIATTLATLAILAILAASGALAAESVELAYGWKPGIAATVRMTGSKVRKSARGTQKTTMSGTYRLVTQAHEKGMQVDFAQMDLVIDSTAAAGGPNMQEFMNKLTSATPSYVIGADGRIVDVAGIDELRASFESAFDTLLADVPEKMKARMEKFMKGLFAGPQLRSRSEESWNRDVGQWLGVQLEMGEDYVLERVQPVAAFGGIEMPMRILYRLNDRVACNPSDTARSCVSLIMKSSISPEGIRPAFEEIFRRMGGATTILNPAPGAPVSQELAEVTDWIIPNETEFTIIARGANLPHDVSDATALAAVAQGLGARLVVTLGDKGAALVGEDGTVEMIPTPQVDAVDTTGAGDAFVGAFAYGLASGWAEADAVRLGCAIAAESVLRPGTQRSFPYGHRCRAIASEIGGGR